MYHPSTSASPSPGVEMLFVSFSLVQSLAIHQDRLGLLDSLNAGKLAFQFAGFTLFGFRASPARYCARSSRLVSRPKGRMGRVRSRRYGALPPAPIEVWMDLHSHRRRRSAWVAIRHWTSAAAGYRPGRRAQRQATSRRSYQSSIRGSAIASRPCSQCVARCSTSRTRSLSGGCTAPERGGREDREGFGSPPAPRLRDLSG